MNENYNQDNDVDNIYSSNEAWIKEITGITFDVNPNEIASHVADDTLKNWCLAWQKAMGRLIITAPLCYYKNKVESHWDTVEKGIPIFMTSRDICYSPSKYACSNCGAKRWEKSKYCPECGATMIN